MWAVYVHPRMVGSFLAEASFNKGWQPENTSSQLAQKMTS